MMVIGLKENIMVKVYSNQTQDLAIKDNGLMTCNMVLVKKNGKMVLDLKVTFNGVKNMEMEFSFGQTKIFIMENLNTI